MKSSLVSGELAGKRCDCLALAVDKDGELPGQGTAVDAAAGGALSAHIGAGELSNEIGASSLLQAPTGLQASRVLLVRTGDRGDNSDLDRALRAAAPALTRPHYKQVISALSAAGGENAPAAIEAELLALHYALYRVEGHKADSDNSARPSRYKLYASGAAARTALAQASAVVAGERLCRDLGNSPPNHCTPGHLAERALAMAEAHAELEVEVLDQERLRRLGMGALLAVAQGSHNPPCLIVMRHRRGGSGAAPLALIGKGVTFDSGGINIKPSDGLASMKYDMCGAAAVFGAMEAAALMQLPVDLIGVVAAAENLCGGGSYRPGDVIKSHAGLSIEVKNTDAEGRLLLADALSYTTGRFKPALSIDLATLTGACVVALGEHCSAVMGNDDALCAELVDAGQRSGDRCWQLPLWDCYRRQLDSHVADISNLGGRAAGAITAGVFLRAFVGEHRWAHLDIAGSAFPPTGEHFASGRPVRLLMRFLRDRIGR